MPIVGLCCEHNLIAGKFTLPRLKTHVFRADKVLKLDRLHFIPKSGARAAKIRDAGFCTDTRTRKKHNVVTTIEELGQGFYCFACRLILNLLVDIDAPSLV